MLWYSADIGTWEAGRIIRFKASNKHDALRRASRICEREGLAMVVQLRRHGIMKPKSTFRLAKDWGNSLYDYHNGWYPNFLYPLSGFDAFMR